jgi:hypothetical protein
VEPGGKCGFSYSVNGADFVGLGSDFTAVNDLWIGAKVGLFCNAEAAAQAGGFVDVDYFRFSP